MSVKSFKFVSPGVFINEIDNSFIPKSADTIGPVVVGRASRGLGMKPVKVESYSDFVTMFGETVPGKAGGDISRYGNYQSPMYGTYAAKAFLRANVAPLTYVRLLGTQNTDATTAGYAGWETEKDPASTIAENGGAYGLFMFPSASVVSTSSVGTGSLAAIWYLDQSASIQLSGTIYNKAEGAGTADNRTAGIAKVLSTDANNLFTVILSSSAAGSEQKIKFGWDDSAETFIRERFNTNPQLVSTAGAFYPSSAQQRYWLGATFEQEVRDRSMVGAAAYGVILPIAQHTTATKGPHALRQSTREAVAGWFIGQDLSGVTGSYAPAAMQKLFRLKGRGHGQWLDRNVKVSIEKLRASTTTLNNYGTFSVVLRDLNDSDNKQVVLERFDNLTLDPTSPNYVARKIGDKYEEWSSTERRLKEYGDYDNKSKFVYVSMNDTVDAGGTDEALLPFGYFGPPKYNDATRITGSFSDTVINNTFIFSGSNLLNANMNAILSGNYQGDGGAGFLTGSLTGSLKFPHVRLRASASDGGLSDPTRACFGMQTTREANGTTADASVADYHKLLFADFPDDPTTYGSQAPTQLSGALAWGYIFSMDDIGTSSANVYHYVSGARKAGTSVGSYTTLLNAGYDSFTAPFWGAYDGFDIKLPDPLYNGGMTAGTSTELNSAPYNTYKQALDSVADPEAVDMNLLVTPGLTFDALTAHMVNVCEERADSLALIDLANVYIPSSEAYYSDKSSRIGTTPTNASTALRDRRIDSSYGCTFYPWVQTRDEATGRLLWVPPSVAMMGVLASSEAKTEIWFAPAGFNRGGLSEGAAGIPVTGVTEKLTSKQRDTLYESNINPIASFPSTGIVVFGQKTLQERQSALDRINVRRLVIYLKKQISILATQILFEQNVQATWNRFKSLVEPFLANVKTRFGITDYKLILDESTTTPDLIDQNILYAKIMIKPARAIEFIAIDFVVMSTGASFED